MTENLLNIDVFCAGDFTVADGVRIGEPLSFADDLVMDDQYRMRGGARTIGLALQDDGQSLRRADGAHNLVHIDCCLTLIAPDGGTHEAVILVEVAADIIAAIYVLPLGDFIAATEYRLIGVERHSATKRFAQSAGGSFARGTLITMGNGMMRPIEDLVVGDEVLTRDSGKQPIRMIDQCTLRASGRFAPIVITKGALHNENDLVLRPDHRLMVYQRADFLGAGRAEVLIKARQLVDGKTVVRRKGGYVDYYQLIFDEHYIIFAEGIAAESHLVNARSRNALTAQAAVKSHRPRDPHDYEFQSNLTPVADIAKLLRRASRG
ncbi:Hint domain-containing protein [Yoonia tamlensis]|uniref:Hint domain-containing protein n=1 Tax=Yoonia tamlensis TaxID=390270 RepID=A0A1I6GIT7_9RHOB|nr:Hint domain-containing protein [Yoonia tamlensis]SFR42133.1 Hint domain-containing protein [Yoonia tamlensis]